MNKLTISHLQPSDYAFEEAMNTLCTNISYCGTDIHSLIFTSRYEQEGKSTITMNVLRTMAGLGKRVILVDADLRRSTLARDYQFQYSVGKVNGLAHFLAGMCKLEDIVYETDIPNVYIIPTGRNVLNSLQLLVSPRFGKMMDLLERNFDIVLVDSPPAGVIVDAVEIAKYCDGAVIVVSHNKGRKQDIGGVVESVSQTGCKVIGAVINNVNMHTIQNRRYYYRSNSYYKSYYKDTEEPQEEKKEE